MPLLVHDATLLVPGDAGVRVLLGHSLVCDSGRITALGPAADFAPRAAHSEFQVVSAAGFIVTPGLINTHHHLYQSLTRGAPDVQDVGLFDWLRGLYPRWQKLDYQAAHLAAQVSIAELLLHGCTTTSDHHYMFPPARDVRCEAVLDAARELGLRIHLCRGSMTLGHSAGGLPPDNCVEHDDDVLTDCMRVLDRWHDPQPFARVRIDLAPCSPFNVTRELLRDTRTLARERGVLLHTHLAETRDEERFCLERFGCRPAQYLADLDWLGSDVYLAHCVCLNDAEIDLLARTGTAVSHNPVSNLRLASGIAPLARMLTAGVRVGLGVDGSSSNDGGNILAAAKQSLLLARLAATLASDPAGDAALPLFSAAQAFRLATVGGASCLNRPELGRLEVGAAADFALFRADDIALAGAAAQDPLGALMLCDAPRATHVYVAGEPVVRDGRLVALDEFALGQQLNALVSQHFR